MSTPLKRVQMLIEPSQHAILAQLAKAQGRSVADVTRQVIAVGLEEVAQQADLAKRARALDRADELVQRIYARLGRSLDIDVVADVHRLREERDEQISGGA